jgi:L-threonylcarbamoyladenylate synthase
MRSVAVTAGTGLVGVRIPAHKVAQALLKAAGVPIAAPSANRFGHVSPTTSEHVLRDLGECPIAVVEDPSSPTSGEGCHVGIESTVIGLGADALTVFRRGGTPLALISKLLAEHDLSSVEVRVVGRAAQSLSEAPSHGSEEAPVETAAHDESEALAAPGQLLTHYAPDVPAALVAWVFRPSTLSASAPSCVVHPLRGSRVPSSTLSGTVVVDVHGHLKTQLLCDESPLAYQNLGTDGGDPAETVRLAQRGVFAALRWAESVPGAQGVLLCDPMGVPGVRDAEGADALRDRLFRAASGGFVGLECVDPSHSSS